MSIRRLGALSILAVLAFALVCAQDSVLETLTVLLLTATVFTLAAFEVLSLHLVNSVIES